MKRFANVFLLILLVPLWHCSTSSGSSPGSNAGDLLRPSIRGGPIIEEPSPTVVRTNHVTVDWEQVTAARSNLQFSAFGQRFRLVRDRVEEIPGKGLIWYGRLAGQPGGSAIFVRIGETVLANIETPRGEVYQLRYAADGIHTFREIDRRRFPDEAPPLQPSLPAGGPAADTCATDPPSDIDVLVAYTPAARTAAGGQAAIEATAYLAVAETNQSYVHSNVTQRLRLVHVMETAYAESGNFNTDLTKLQNPSDTVMDDVPVQRNVHAADVVSLILQTGTACGLGYFMNPVTNGFEAYAYSVVRRDCATGYFSFGHELGHNMSADHDVANSSGSGPYPYNHGYTETTPTFPATPWRTIMAYQTSPASTRVQYWSNPSVNYPVGGDPMGDAATADNHRVLNNTALTVANFRCSSPSVPNVWMKDTWNDTGAEPDPATAADPMWISPYIWVRNTQDTGLVHQHQHENPEFGTTNWAYVKLHNGGSTVASGNLELYIANASVSLTWPGSWTQIASLPVAGLAAHSTRVVETSWTPPGAGHYCMVARWNSAADPMTTAEGPDINANVRANNNLVWRNLNIVDLLPDGSEDVEMTVMNADQFSGPESLVIRPGRGRGLRSFFADGVATVELDGLLLDAWNRGGAKGTGFVREGGRFRITSAEGARFDGLQLIPGHPGRLKVTFRRLASTPKGEYRVDIEHRREPEYARKYQSSEVVGGVSYEIHTDRDRARP
ncbi:MAG TPA: M12 family metallo-peptidase [Thermoanaerobaculia bacterium]